VTAVHVLDVVSTENPNKPHNSPGQTSEKKKNYNKLAKILGALLDILWFTEYIIDEIDDGHKNNKKPGHNEPQGYVVFLHVNGVLTQSLCVIKHGCVIL